MDAEKIPELIESVWFDAMSESIYQTMVELGTLDELISEEIALHKDELSDSKDTMKSVLTGLLKDISIAIEDFRIQCALSQTSIFKIVIPKITVQDQSKDLRATDDHLIVAKTLHIDRIEAYIDDSMLLQVSESIEFQFKLYLDGHAEVEGEADELIVQINSSFSNVFLSFFKEFQSNNEQKTENRREIIVIGKFHLKQITLNISAGENSLCTHFQNVAMRRYYDIDNSFHTNVSIDDFQIADFQSNSGTSISIDIIAGVVNIKIGELIRLKYDETLKSILNELSTIPRNERISKSSGIINFKAAGFLIDFSDDRSIYNGLSIQALDIYGTYDAKSSSMSFKRAIISFGRSTIDIEFFTFLKSAAIGGYNPPKEQFQPFSKMKQVIEDEIFVDVSDTDDHQKLKEDIQLHSSDVVSCSARNMVLKIDWNDCNRILNYNLDFAQNETVSDQSLNFLSSSINLELNIAGINYDAMIADLCVLKYTSLVDLRGNILEVKREKEVLIHKILTLSLEGKEKSLILTKMEKITSICLSGLEILIPLDLNLNNELEALKMMSSSESKSKNEGIQLYTKFFRCSFSPIIPKSWPKCFPTTLLIDTLRIMHTEANILKIYLNDSTIFVARKRKEASPFGIYIQGGTYWEDRGFVAICKLGHLRIILEASDNLVVKIHDEDFLMELREDSFLVLQYLLNYATGISRYGKNSSIAVSTSGQKNLDALNDLDENMFMAAKKPNEQLNESVFDMDGIDENFFGVPDDLVEGAFALISPTEEWSHIDKKIQMEAMEAEDEMPLEGVNTEELDALNLEDNFFNLLKQDEPFRFPFKSDEAPGSVRIQLFDCSLKIIILEGIHFNYGKNNKNPSFVHAESTSGSLTGSPMETASPSLYNIAQSEITSSPSCAGFSKWSTFGGNRPNLKAEIEDSLELYLDKIDCEIDLSDVGLLAFRLRINTVRVTDHLKSSKWKTVFDKMSGPNIPEEDPMVHLELSLVEIETINEYKLKVKIAPIRICIDQDLIKFLDRYLVSGVSKDTSDDEMIYQEQIEFEPLFFQHCDIGEIWFKIDYKPKRIDLGNLLKLGNLAELVNLFRVEDAEVKLPPASLKGIKGITHFRAELLRSWLPYVKSTQVGPLLKGINPVRTVVNLGTGISDLILLPMSNYQEEGRILKGLRMGTRSFLKNTVKEGARLGSRLAISTQVILEHIDDIFEGDIDRTEGSSKFSNNPKNLHEGLKQAYRSLKEGTNDALQTIVAIPVQVYEKEGPEGAMKAVIRAVPVAILRPAIGASQAVSKTMLGLESSIDPSRGVDIRRKYK